MWYARAQGVKLKYRENIKIHLILKRNSNIVSRLLFLVNFPHMVEKLHFVWGNIFFAYWQSGLTGGGVAHGISVFRSS